MHTRVTEIRYLAISPEFKVLDELKDYLDLYWQYDFIPHYDGDLSPSIFTGHWVGHPAGGTHPVVNELLKLMTIHTMVTVCASKVSQQIDKFSIVYT